MTVKRLAAVGEATLSQKPEELPGAKEDDDCAGFKRDGDTEADEGVAVICGDLGGVVAALGKIGVLARREPEHGGHAWRRLAGANFLVYFKIAESRRAHGGILSLREPLAKVLHGLPTALS
jgi:hypothetical protein